MKQTQKLSALISRIIKEELAESDYMFIKNNDPKKIQKKTAARQEGLTVIEDDPTDTTSDELKTTLEAEKEMQQPDMEQQPKGSEIAGQVAEIMEKLKAMTSGDDKKKVSHASKVMKHMESAKAALEALAGHEAMLEEKEQAVREKDAQGHLKAIEKHLGKIVKDKDAVGKMMKKMPIEKVIAMKQQMQNKELDEEKLAKVMLKHSLKEGWIKKIKF